MSKDRVTSCLVLDVSLPGLNGLDLQKRVAVERPDMPIIFITGCARMCPLIVRATNAAVARPVLFSGTIRVETTVAAEKLGLTPGESGRASRSYPAKVR
jgi:DNA-binding NtrC family response regulator